MSGVGDWRRNAVEAASQVTRFAAWYGMQRHGDQPHIGKRIVATTDNIYKLAVFTVAARRTGSGWALDVVVEKGRGDFVKVVTLRRSGSDYRPVASSDSTKCGFTYRRWVCSTAHSVPRKDINQSCPGLAFVRPRRLHGELFLYVSLGDRAWTEL